MASSTADTDGNCYVLRSTRDIVTFAVWPISRSPLRFRRVDGTIHDGEFHVPFGVFGIGAISARIVPMGVPDDRLPHARVFASLVGMLHVDIGCASRAPAPEPPSGSSFGERRVGALMPSPFLVQGAVLW